MKPLTHQEKLIYKAGVISCYHIMHNLYEVYGDYSEVGTVFLQFKDAMKKDLKEKGIRV